MWNYLFIRGISQIRNVCFPSRCRYIKSQILCKTKVNQKLYKGVDKYTTYLYNRALQSSFIFVRIITILDLCHKKQLICICKWMGYENVFYSWTQPSLSAFTLQFKLAKQSFKMSKIRSRRYIWQIRGKFIEQNIPSQWKVKRIECP